MQKFKSHKVVEAGLLRELVLGSHIVVANGTTNETIEPTPDWWERYQASNQQYVGGYYVRYADGYDSWSPAAPFEEGYELA